MTRDATTGNGLEAGAVPDRTAVLLYGPTFNALGGGEVWLNRIANAMVAEGRVVRVLGKARPQAVVQHEWDPAIACEYLDTAISEQRAMTRRRTAVRAVLDGRATGALRGAVDRLILGWRPPSAFIDDVAPAALERLAVTIEEFAERHPGSRVAVICTDVYTGSHVAHLRRANRVDVPYLVMHHNSFASLSRGTLRAYRRAANEAEAFIALTDEDNDAFRQAGFQRVRTVHNPGPPARGRVSSEPRKQTVAWLARMTRVKRGDLAIRAWARVAEEFGGWRLQLFGDGPERQRLERLARRLGVQSTVEFRGVTDDPMGVWSTSAVGLLTSGFEGWPLVIGEAAGMGVPMVATDCAPGVREQISDGVDGILVPVGDERALAEALRHMMRNPADRAEMGAAAQRHAASYDIERVLAEWRAVLDPAREVRR